MLLDFASIIKKYKIEPRGIVHVGAHHFLECSEYRRIGFEYIVGVEPCKEAFEVANKTGAIMFNCAIGEENGSAIMNVERDNQGQSNSLLQPKKHLIQHPNIRFTETEEVEVRTLDSLPFIRERVNVIAVDVQGNEGAVFKGANKTLQYIDCIYTEVNYDETYATCMLFPELKELLSDFEVVAEHKVGIWGDAVFIRKSLLNANN